jgi:SAM-dependent methyltransferase
VIDNQTFYNHSFDIYGQSPKGLSWSSQYTQEIRFEIITQLLFTENSSQCSIVDAGCGFADLYEYWQNQGISPLHYIGIDSMEKFIQIASKRFTKVSFLQRDILKDALPKADWYIASGSLNILNDFQTWLFLEKMLLFSRKGIVFNILQGEKKSYRFNYKTPDEIETFAQTKNLTCKIIQGYLPNDMSVMISKEVIETTK